MKSRNQHSHRTSRVVLVALLMLPLLAGCRNPGEEGQGQTHTQTTPDNHRYPQPGNVPTPPSADRIDPSSPRAVLGGTSTTSPSNGVAGAH